MGKTYVVVAEVRGGSLRQVTLEALQAVSIACQEGDSTAAILIGSQTTKLASELAGYVDGKIYSIDHPELEIYNPETYLNVMKSVFERVTPDVVVLGHTAQGRDLGPAIAAHLGAGQISDVIAIEKSDDDEAVYTRPLYAGKAFEQKQFTGGAQVVTIRPNNINPSEAAASAGEVIELEYAPSASLRSIVKDVVRKTSGKVDLTEAKIVVSGGRGVKSAEGFKPLEELADVLHGAVGASRAACDAGYCDYSMQIGQTGKVVTPEIYIACGISGAIQHLAGMSQSRVIIAINKDPEAPIFKVADYGIVGDLFEVVPLLTQEFRKVLV
ncbi:electron transfer flavoprotein subunit alpha/FixB family protein [Paenibacillus dokdonensis]|uniref:Electron transfer flavoprotein subunit alpha/FixB family protein n=1 Tax=Paenibacillus dokdonensis TaxID=2567944 RepID=A0ABU6GIZ1_9BACL|nr:electron transfer flavoprotein subunit alpha/FixB family protein [Paenibacillus dokdonensis]MEC0239720.1 electron transfer flavoprotein subunit alpha/FixB family protein [Paenibacillus dokdonensis]